MTEFDQHWPCFSRCWRPTLENSSTHTPGALFVPYCTTAFPGASAPRQVQARLREVAHLFETEDAADRHLCQALAIQSEGPDKGCDAGIASDRIVGTDEGGADHSSQPHIGQERGRQVPEGAERAVLDMAPKPLEVRSGHSSADPDCSARSGTELEDEDRAQVQTRTRDRVRVQYHVATPSGHQVGVGDDRAITKGSAEP